MKRIFSLTVTTLSLVTIFCIADETAQASTPTPAPAPTEQVAPKPFLNLKQDDWATYGLDKLTPEERSALETWIKKNIDLGKKDVAEKSEPIKLQAINKGAKTIELADGRKFELSASARKVASLWNVGDLIRVESGKKKNSVTLFHVPSNKSIKAKVASEKDKSTEE